jgi:FMN phosphatase YigB (HAD superfamily)
VKSSASSYYPPLNLSLEENLNMKQVKALIFDIFGTVVDWRTSIEAELKALGDKHGVEADWPKFAQDWRTSYMEDTQVHLY